MLLDCSYNTLAHRNLSRVVSSHYGHLNKIIYLPDKIDIYTVILSLYHFIINKYQYNDIAYIKYYMSTIYNGNKNIVRRIKIHYLILSHIKYFYKIKDEIDAIYTPSVIYDRGVLIECAIKYNINIYFSIWPFYLLRLKTDNIHNSTDIFKVRKVHGYLDKSVANNILEDNTKVLPYLKNIKYNEYNNKSDYEYIVYVHSFTDAIHPYGYDESFNNMEEWLKFTLKILKDKCVLIKAHPAFYSNTNVAEIDKIIFKKIVNKYSIACKHEIIDYSVNNYDLLKQFDKSNTILVSHHSNSVVEGALLGFSSITSRYTLWRDYNLSSTYSNKKDYKIKLLNKEMLRTNKEDVIRYYSDLCNPYTSFKLFDIINKEIDIHSTYLKDHHVSDMADKIKTVSWD